MDTALIVALVGVAAAILGSLVGGWVTGRVTSRVERERHERQRTRDAEREAIAVRGIARVTSARLGAAIATCRPSLQQGLWLPRELEMPPPLPIEDRKLLASVMPVEKWVLLDTAEYALAVEEATRRMAPEPKLSESDREVIQQAQERLQAGQAALKDLATQ